MNRLFSVLIISMLPVTCLLYGQAFLEDPVKASVSLSPISTREYIEIEIKLEIRENVHVYTDKDNNFEIRESVSGNLGKSTVVLPETVKYKDALGVLTDVFKEHNPVIRIRKPFTG